MNALSMYQNVTAEESAKAQSGLDTTAPVVDPYRPEVSERIGGPSKGETLGATVYHFMFVGLFLFGGLVALGSLTGEIEIKKG